MKILLGVILSVVIGSAAQWHVLSWAGDATLKEIQFADSLQGWAIADHNLFHSTDRGRTWSVERSIADTTFSGLAVIDSGHIFVSSWRVYYPRYLFWWVWIEEYASGIWRYCYSRQGVDISGGGARAGRIAVLDDMHLWHSGGGYYDVSVRTKDGGATWVAFQYFRLWENDLSFIDSLTGWASLYNGKIAWTTNAGNSWTDRTDDVGARRIQMFDSLNGWVLSTSGLMHTTTGGVSWDTVVAESGLKAMRFCNPRHGVAVGAGGVILHTTDAGVTWLRDTIVLGTENYLDLHAVWMVDSAHAWAAGENGIVLGMGDWALPGIEEQRQLLNPLRLVGVWPNPCRRTLWVQCRGGPGTIAVYDNSGRPVAKRQCSLAGAQELDLRGLPAGVYFARATSSPQSSIRFVLLR
jgi:photosystem II stability/assembly factor-like uncharacterized protein